MKIKREDIRNIAIIAHVDHGKNDPGRPVIKAERRIPCKPGSRRACHDSNDIERERGITILSKNTAVFYKGVKINIIDTPGHADLAARLNVSLKW